MTEAQKWKMQALMQELSDLADSAGVKTWLVLMGAPEGTHVYSGGCGCCGCAELLAQASQMHALQVAVDCPVCKPKRLN